ncbi:hypothetical protein J3R83DRAFT_11030 [Lanmaoa asiatica]|nr:hypothetical protein J3R83DRAFT_11030 [Lanmaoa asiatica]
MSDVLSLIVCTDSLLSLQSNECQASDWPYHRTKCTPAPSQKSRLPPSKVWGVTIACNADRARGARPFEAKIIDPSHAIHTQGILCPLFQQVGFPLVLFRHLPDDPASMTRDPELDNQIAAHLMTHPNPGHPGEKWHRAGCLGTVTVMRQDGKSLSFEAIETALMYVDHLIGMFRDGVFPTHLMNPAGFQRFCQRYKEERILSGNMTFQTMTIPL